MQLPDSIPPEVPPAPEIHPFSPAPPPEDPAWGLLDVAVIAVFTIVLLPLSVLVVLGVMYSLPRFQRFASGPLGENVFVLIPGQTLAYLGVVVFMVLLVRSKRRGGFLSAISWNEPSLARTVAAFSGGVGLAVFSSIFSALLSHWIPQSLPVEKLFHDRASTYLLSAFGVGVAPFMEEMFFRGFLYPALARHIGVNASVALTAAGFAVVHQGQLAHAWVPLTWLFIVGVVLTIVRARTKSLATCVLLHLAYNATLFTFLYFSTQGFRHMERA